MEKGGNITYRDQLVCLLLDPLGGELAVVQQASYSNGPHFSYTYLPNLAGKVVGTVNNNIKFPVTKIIKNCQVVAVVLAVVSSRLFIA